MDTYAERLNWAMARHEPPLGQSDLARLTGIKPQAVQYLCDPKRAARGSKHTPQLAAALGVSPHWLATGKGRHDDPPGAAGYRVVPELRAMLTHPNDSAMMKMADQLAADWALLLDEDQERIKAEVHRLAESARAYRAKFDKQRTRQ